MKKIALILIILMVAPAVYGASTAFVTPKDLTPQKAAGARYGFELRGDTESNSLVYPYYMLNSTGKIIRPYNDRSDGKLKLIMKNWDSVPGVNVGECIAVDDPHDCCTGEGTGTCDDTFLNADCTARGEPTECCTGLGEGICQGWSAVLQWLVPLNNYLKGELEKWENVTFE